MNIKMVCAYLAGLGAIGWSSFVIITLMNMNRITGKQLLASITVLIPCAAILYLIFSQKLYSFSESDKIEEQNKILRMQIEQKKLKNELKSN